MVKVIVADRKLDCEHLVGQFLDESHYDVLLEEDCDVYAPPNCDLGTQADCDMPHDCGACANGTDERRIVLKFRKNYFTKEQQDQAYAGLREAATETQNRGAAAGPRAEKLGNREWVTAYQTEVLEYLKNPRAGLAGIADDPIEEIKQKYATNKDIVSNRNNVWSIERTKENDFNFDTWLEETRKLPLDKQTEAAKFVDDNLVCATTYANSVFSGIAGWYDRYPRIPYGRATAYTAKFPEKFAMAYPFLQTLANGFKELLPWRYGNQMKAASKIDPRFVVPGTPFTTITVNKSFRTAAHYDAGDYSEGLSNLLVLSNNGNYEGCYLVAPEYRVAVNVRPGDLLLINNHEVLHGNTPIKFLDDEAERISLVCYLREGMFQLGSKEYEDCRFQFVEDRKNNKEHPLHKRLWNGVSEGMWSSQEWYDYCEQKLGRDELLKYHPDAGEKSSLEGFF